MAPDEIQRLANNDKEWRIYMLTKIDRLEKELQAFKFQVLVIVISIGGASGFGAAKLAKLLGFLAI